MCEYCDNHQISFGTLLFTGDELETYLDEYGFQDGIENHGIPVEFCPCCGRSMLESLFEKYKDKIKPLDE